MYREPETDQMLRPPEADDLALKEAQEQAARAEKRLLDAAIAFCDGQISAGQLKAVREFHREKLARLEFLRRGQPTATEDEEPAAVLPADPEPTQPLIESAVPQPMHAPPELRARLRELENKLHDLDRRLQAGDITRSQFEAIRSQYIEQRLSALEMYERHPESEGWRLVLEEGKTTVLMQLNEAACSCVALYELATRDQLYVHGVLPPEAEEAMTLLRTFGSPEAGASKGKMYATRTDSGLTLLLIPGRYSAALVVFSEDPPSWQVRALREVLSNFEIANRVSLDRADRRALIFPNLRRFVKG